MIKSIENFVRECKISQPDLAIGAKYYFRGIVALPLERELLLQAYFVDNMENIIGKIAELILYEKPLPKELSNNGRIDLIFITHENKILVVETKHLTIDTGSTACTNRRKHRKMVFDQIQKDAKKLVDNWMIDPNDIEQIVFTNDEDLGSRKENGKVKFFAVTNKDLDDWKKVIVDGLPTYFDDGHFQAI